MTKTQHWNHRVISLWLLVVGFIWIIVNLAYIIWQSRIIPAEAELITAIIRVGYLWPVLITLFLCATAEWLCLWLPGVIQGVSRTVLHVVGGVVTFCGLISLIGMITVISIETVWVDSRTEAIYEKENLLFPHSIGIHERHVPLSDIHYIEYGENPQYSLDSYLKLVKNDGSEVELLWWTGTAESRLKAAEKLAEKLEIPLEKVTISR